MKLLALTDGTVTGSGTLTFSAHHTGGTLGGILVSTDGTNAAVVVIRRVNASGKQIFSISTKTPGFFTAPIDSEGTDTIHYSVTGTGASAQLFEWAN